MKKYSIGIDVGGTNIKFGLVDDRAKIVDRAHLSTENFTQARGKLIEAIVERIRQMAGHLASRIETIDYFKGGQTAKGKKILCFRIFYQAPDRTLQNEEVNRLHFAIIDSLNQSLGAELPKAKQSQ